MCVIFIRRISVVSNHHKDMVFGEYYNFSQNRLFTSIFENATRPVPEYFLTAPVDAVLLTFLYDFIYSVFSVERFLTVIF